MKQRSMLNNIIDLWKYLGKRRRLQFFFLFILNIISVVSEVISIGAVIPFLSALTAPEKLMAMSWFQPVINILKIQSADQLLLPITLGFIIAAITATGVRILLLWVNAHLSASMGIQLRNEVFKKALYQSYEFHIKHNSSQLISVVTEKIGVAINAGIAHVLLLITSLLVSIAIIVTLLLINTFVAFVAFVVLGGGYILIGFMVNRQIRHSGEIITRNQPEAVKCMQEGLGGIRDIIINNSQSVFIRAYNKVSESIQLAGMRNIILSSLPKSLLEMLGIVLIASMAYYLQCNATENKTTILPILGALALGAQRLLPALQQVYYSWTIINAAQPALSDVLHYLHRPVGSNIEHNKITPLPFNKNIQLKSIYFKYDSSDNYVLNNININILKGSRVGFIGSTGSGKSTLVDVVMGLLYPSQGELLIDGMAVNNQILPEWQANIAHVPQNIFLSDASIAENIAFGVPKDKIDFSKVKRAAKQAQISTFITQLPQGYKTSVGERGVQLSGGQRQRIGIARALYKQASVIVFDEATSALDDQTEKNVMSAIDSLDKNLTLLIIAHRLSTLKGCNQIFRLDKGRIVESGSYTEIVSINEL